MTDDKTCPKCQGPIHYAGRRDLLAWVQAAECVLRRVACAETVATDPRADTTVAWLILRGARCDGLGLCRECDFDATSYPVNWRPGTCSFCKREGLVGIGPDKRCPCLGCPGTILERPPREL
jgi:hypothetical protein